MAMRQPVAYIRKSRVINGHSVSWEVQEHAVRALAAADGHGELLLLSDWNRSGSGTSRRPGYRQMVAMIEAGEVSAVYAYSLSRFCRSIRDFLALVDTCVARTVPIRFATEAILNVDTASATSTLFLNILASFAQFDAQVAQERAREAVAVRRARGDRIGHPFYGERKGEDAGAVVAAFREAGSIMGAARLLNARGVPTRQGRPWGTTSARETLLRLGAMPHRSRPGAKAAAPFVLYGLLRCHCGHILTGSRYRNGSDLAYTAYKCHLARTVAGHGLGAVPERRILPLIRAEAARLRVPSAIETETHDQAQRAALGARRQRIIDNYEDGLIGKVERDSKVAAVVDELERLDAARVVVAIPTIDWSWPAEKINGVLRALWERVELGPDMAPARFVWTVPEWRAD